MIFINSRRLAERLALAERDRGRGDRPRPPRLGRAGAATRDRGAASRRARSRASSRRPRSSSGSTWAPSTSSSRSRARSRSPAACSGSAERDTTLGVRFPRALFPKYRADLLESAVVARAMREGEVEETRIPRNPLDVLAQQIVAIVRRRGRPVDDLHALVRRARIPSPIFARPLEGVLDMLAGRYPSDEFAELRPRLTWDRAAGIRARAQGARRLAVTNAGTIPDRGLYGVHPRVDGGGARRRARRGDGVEAPRGADVLLGASSWRIEDITRDRVMVSPAPGVPGKMPSGTAKASGRPAELGRAIGALCRELVGAEPTTRARRADSRGTTASMRRAATNLIAFLREQERRRAWFRPTERSSSSASATRSATCASACCRRSAAGCTPRGRWRSRRCANRSTSTRVALVGRRHRAPLPRRRRAAAARRSPARSRRGRGPAGRRSSRSSALFASRFRENAARALLLPRRRPGQRTPLWQQRLKRAAACSRSRAATRTFPIMLETYRECLRDVFDLPALSSAAQDRDARRSRRGGDGVGLPVRSLAPVRLRRHVIYEDDAPLAERRAQALSLDRACCAS